MEQESKIERADDIIFDIFQEVWGEKGYPYYDLDKVIKACVKYAAAKDQYKQPEHGRGCPCLYLDEPCHPMCTCKNGASSLGCMFCATYGSLEQRKAAAERIAKKLRQQPEQGMKWVLGEDDPFPLKEVLRIFINAANTLLHKKDYDGPDYEELEICIMRGKEIIKLLDESPNEHDAND